MKKTILVLLLIAFSGFVLAGCKTEQAVLDSLCEAQIVRVTPEIKAEFRKWLQHNGRLRVDAPKGAEAFLKDLKFNQDLIREHCGK